MSALESSSTGIPADSLNALSAEQIVSKIKTREFSCQELLSYYEAQYLKDNSRINAIVATNFTEARKRSIAAD